MDHSSAPLNILEPSFLNQRHWPSFPWHQLFEPPSTQRHSVLSAYPGEIVILMLRLASAFGRRVVVGRAEAPDSPACSTSIARA